MKFCMQHLFPLSPGRSDVSEDLLDLKWTEEVESKRILLSASGDCFPPHLPLNLALNHLNECKNSSNKGDGANVLIVSTDFNDQHLHWVQHPNDFLYEHGGKACVINLSDRVTFKFCPTLTHLSYFLMSMHLQTGKAEVSACELPQWPSLVVISNVSTLLPKNGPVTNLTTLFSLLNDTHNYISGNRIGRNTVLVMCDDKLSDVIISPVGRQSVDDHLNVLDISKRYFDSIYTFELDDNNPQDPVSADTQNTQRTCTIRNISQDNGDKRDDNLRYRLQTKKTNSFSSHDVVEVDKLLAKMKV